jgi:hypothetical protein
MPNAGRYFYKLLKLLIENNFFADEEIGKTCLIFTHICEIWYLVVSYEYKQKVLENMGIRRAQSGIILRVLP